MTSSNGTFSASLALSFVWGIHRWPVNSPLKGQWRGALVFSWICAWIKGWANNRKAGDLRGHRAHHDVTVMVRIILGKYFMSRIPCQNNISLYTNGKKKLYIRKSATIFPIYDITLRYFDTTVMIFVVDTQQIWRYRSTDVSVDDKGAQNSVRTISSECVNPWH